MLAVIDNEGKCLGGTRAKSLKGGEEVSHQISKLTCGTQMNRVAEQEWRLEVTPPEERPWSPVFWV